MTPTQRAAAQQALEKIAKAHTKIDALCLGNERWTMSVPIRPDHDHDLVISGALYAAAEFIRTALAEQPAEPVAWQGVYDPTDLYWRKPPQTDVRPLYTAPQPAKRVPLTDDEINEAYGDARVKWGHIPHDDVARIARAIERAHGITGETK